MDGVECDLYNVNFGLYFGGIFFNFKNLIGYFLFKDISFY